MRPRHLCLGCIGVIGMYCKDIPASMRPRHLCLGCDNTITARPNRREVGFNEAEASLPRMLCRSLPDADRDARRFNEAEASLPRMLRKRADEAAIDTQLQ